MKERPILFSGPMVRAILEGKKTQTRRVVKPQPASGLRQSPFVPSGLEDGHGREIRFIYGLPGDRLWVKETWQPFWKDVDRPPASLKDPKGWEIGYVATDGVWEWHDEYKEELSQACRPSIFMPRWASRITLEVVSIRVQRIQEISLEDVLAEGVEPSPDEENIGQYWREATYQQFIDLWDSINKARGFGWDTNPWVWVVEFKRLNTGQMED